MSTTPKLTEHQCDWIDGDIDDLIATLCCSDDSIQFLHYVIQRVIIGVVKPEYPRDYETTVGLIGMLESVKLDVAQQLRD